MNITIDMALLVTAFLVFVRMGALFLLTPLFASGRLPVRIRVLWLLPLSFVLVGSLGVLPIAEPLSVGELVSAAVSELLVGALMAFGVFAAFAAFLFGGRILDFQMGFGVANLIDPSTNMQAPLLGTFLSMLAVLVFFVADGHHLIIKGVAYSLETVPPGQGIAALDPGPVVTQFGLMFVYGLMVVAPAVFALLLIDVGMAVAARTMPQVNMFIVGLPLKIFVGLVMLALSISYLPPLLNKVFVSIFRYWEAVLV